MRIKSVLSGVVVSLSVAACGGGGGGGALNDSNLSQFNSATSLICTEITGPEAIYWDFINGQIRTDLPSTAFTIPFNVGGIYSNESSPPASLLLGYTVPLGWAAENAVDVTGFASPFQFVGSNLIRNDNQAVWRYISNAQLVVNGYSSAGLRDAELNAALNFLNNPAVSEEQCRFTVQQQGILGLESAAGKIVRAGEFTIMTRASVLIVNGVGAYYSGSTTVARTAEMPALINDIFVPMITQLYRGGTDLAACEDGVDNDGDGLIDLADPQCAFPDDQSEST